MISLVLLLAMTVMFAVGFFLMMDRSLTRILLGFLLAGNAVNLLIFMMSGQFGAAPILFDADHREMTDPLPQAFILTAIVITFGVSAFMLALMYRAWALDRANDDTVLTDEEDSDLVHATGAIILEEVLDEEVSSSHEFDDEDQDGSANETGDMR